MDRAAEAALASPLQDASRFLSAETLVIWVGSFQSVDEKINLIYFNQLQYYDQWLYVLREIQKVVPSDWGGWEHECRRLRDFCQVYRNLADGPKSLRKLDDTFTGSRDILGWKNKAGEMVAKVKSFSELSRCATGVS